MERSSKKIVVRVLGGLGNQLFCYASAYGIARSVSAQLVVDNVSGFARDFRYRRTFTLGKMSLSAETWSPALKGKHVAMLARISLKVFSRVYPKNPWVRYVSQNKIDFDSSLGSRIDASFNYLDGFWQSYKYFEKYRSEILDEFKPKESIASKEAEIVRVLQQTGVGAIHYRFFTTGVDAPVENLSLEYYRKAMAYAEKHWGIRRWILFSDRPQELAKIMGLISDRHVLVSVEAPPGSEVSDLFVLSHAQTIIIANSTFSWWAAWLGNERKNIICPAWEKRAGLAAWGFGGLIPETWNAI